MVSLTILIMPNQLRSHGYHPVRKLKVILAGLHVAVVTDFRESKGKFIEIYQRDWRDSNPRPIA